MYTFHNITGHQCFVTFSLRCIMYGKCDDVILPLATTARFTLVSKSEQLLDSGIVDLTQFLIFSNVVALGIVSDFPPVDFEAVCLVLAIVDEDWWEIWA